MCIRDSDRHHQADLVGVLNDVALVAQFFLFVVPGVEIIENIVFGFEIFGIQRDRGRRIVAAESADCAVPGFLVFIAGSGRVGFPVCLLYTSPCVHVHDLC